MTLLLSLSDILYTFSDTFDFFISIVYFLIYVSSYILVCISLLPESLWPLVILPICLPGSSVVKNPLADAGDIGDAGSNPGQKDSLKEEMATHSSIVSWKIPWREEPGRLQSIGLQRVACPCTTEQRAHTEHHMILVVRNYVLLMHALYY